MVSRRQTLKIIASSLLVPALPLGRVFAAGSSKRATDPACASCASDQEMRKIYSNVLDSIPYLKRASLPRLIYPIRRSPRSGAGIQYVETATGALTFSTPDLVLRGFPSIKMTRYYNSKNTKDTGFGPGWASNFDDTITVTGQKALFKTAAGDSVAMFSTGGGVFSATYPGLSLHTGFVVVDANTISEIASEIVTRTYTRFGDIYYLTELKYGDVGSLSINRDTSGRMLSLQTSAGGFHVAVTWNDNRIIGLTDNIGRTVTFNYSSNLLSSVKDTTGELSSYEYSGGLLSLVSDALGTPVLAVMYGGGGRVSSTSAIEGLYTYDYEGAFGAINTTTIETPQGLKNIYVHNSNGQVVSVTRSGESSPALTASFDPAGRVSSVQTSTGTHTYQYNSVGQLTYLSQGKRWKQWEFDSDGRVLSITDPAGPTKYSYASDNTLSGATSSRKVRTYSSTYANGQLASLTTHNRTIYMTYTPTGKLASMKDSKKGTVKFGYDLTGQLTSEQSSCGYSAYSQRNARGFLSEWRDSEGIQFTFQRDIRGALNRVVNTSGEWATASRDSAGRIVKLTNSRGQSRAFGYDSSGTMTSYTDAKGRAFNVVYDTASSKAIKMVAADGSAEIVRNAQGQCVLQMIATQGTANASSQTIDDEWFDPLLADGLLGSFSGFGRYAANMYASTKGTSVPPSLAQVMAMGGADTGQDDRGDDSDDDDDDDDGDDGDDDDDDDDQDDTACQNCEQTYMNTCSSSYNDAGDSAQLQELATDLGCTLLPDDSEYYACLAAAEIVYQTQAGTANTNYNNCVALIPQNCYSQCSGN